MNNLPENTDTMSISEGMLAHARLMHQSCPDLQVSGLYLPTPGKTEFCDEFGFIILNSGTIGPFYVSLDDTLTQLWQRFPEPAQMHLPLSVLLEQLTATDLPDRALALGAYNALSQYVMQRANYQPAKRRNKTDTHQHQGAIGMVGYFGPLIERLVTAGRAVIVLEKLPERVLPHPLVRHITTPQELGGCQEILCTASTLVNNTLGEILEACSGTEHFSLVGPSASGLPDAFFSHGVDSVGAIRFADQHLLQQTMAAGGSWGKAGNKYEISKTDYPGLTQLLDRSQHQDHS